MKIDPICGMEVAEEPGALTSVYKGQTYYFCCPHCKAEFDRNPAQHIK
jgi:YHS domain-containing protein